MRDCQRTGEAGIGERLRSDEVLRETTKLLPAPPTSDPQVCGQSGLPITARTWLRDRPCPVAAERCSSEPGPSSDRAIAPQDGPFLKAQREDRDERRHQNLREESCIRNPERLVVVAEILPELRHAGPFAAAATMGPVERGEEHGDDFEHPPP